MTDANSSAPMQLCYCPTCHQLIKPSLFASREAVLRNGGYYHVACLAKAAGGTEASASSSGVLRDDQGLVKTKTESIAHALGRKPSGGFESLPPGNTRRKTTGAVATSAGRTADPPTGSQRRPLVSGHSHSPVRKSSPVPMILAGVVALGLIAIGGYFLLHRTGRETWNPPVVAGHSSNPAVPAGVPPVATTGTPSKPVGVAPLPSNPLPTVPPGGGAPPLVPDTAPTPYELAQRNKPLVAPVIPAAGFEPAGPTVSWFDGTSLGDWKFVKGNPDSVTVKEGAIEINPGDSMAFFEHAIPTPDYDLSFEFRLGPADAGAYSELWLPSGVIMMSGGDFQSENWTPVQISVRGGKLTARCGSKGSTDLHPAAVDTTPATDLRAALMGGRPVALFTVGVTDTKSLRNIQYTPMRPVAAPPAPVPAPEPAQVVNSTPAESMVAKPVEIKADAADQPQGHWGRMTVVTEDGKNFLSWSNPETKLTLFFQCTLPNRGLPKTVHVQVVCRIRNTPAREITVRLYGPGNFISGITLAVPEADQWQTLDMELPKCPGTFDQLEVRLPATAGAAAQLDIARVTLSLPEGASPQPGK